MIESYEFGRIVIDGKEYNYDVMIFKNKVESWRRKESHKLQVDDIKTIAEKRPEVLIVGTGYSGFMEVLPEVEKYLKSKGIELIADLTEKACEIYNNISKKRNVAAVLHLTC